jgi:starch phosphorylase
VRRQVVFTTHTPVAAGNETHRLELIAPLAEELGLPIERVVEIGGDPFGMTVAGLRLSWITSAVAQLHGETARAMWRDVSGAAPIVAVTNGVHPPTWQDERLRVGYARGTLWEAHQQAKRELLGLIRERTGATLHEDRLLVGFARRAAAYKRADLVLRDAAWLAPLLTSRRLQLVFAGKAHPHDGEGKKIIAALLAMARQHPESIVFLQNYDMSVARRLVRGCDVWLNTPRRPMEASGTSGMKAAMNGVLNLSVLDGWWPEGCVHGVNGWQIGDGFRGPRSGRARRQGAATGAHRRGDSDLRERPPALARHDARGHRDVAVAVLELPHDRGVLHPPLPPVGRAGRLVISGSSARRLGYCRAMA